MSVRSETINEPDTSKFANVESLRFPMPVDCESRWNVTTSYDTSLVTIKIPLLSSEIAVLSEPASPM